MPSKNIEQRNETYKKYNDAHSRHVSLKFNISTDADILARIAQADGIQGFIKQCIREHIAAEDERGELF